jgi:hypothetical protein
MMAISETKEDVRKALERQLKREPDPEIWDLLVADRYVSEVLRSFDEAEHEEHLEKLEKRYRRLAILARGSRRTRAPERRETEPDARADALAFILSAEAHYQPLVRRFRRVTLQNELPLKPSQASSWIKKQIHAQGDPTVSIERAMSPSGRPMPLGAISWNPRPELFQKSRNPSVARLLPKEVTELIESGSSPLFPRGKEDIEKISTLSINHSDPAMPGSAWSLRTETISISGFPDLPVRLGSALSELKRVSMHLEQSLGLTASDWAWFVLTGVPPEPSMPSASVRPGPCPALDMIQINIGPNTGRDEVAQILLRSKKRLVALEQELSGSKFTFGQKITDTRIRLAMVAAQLNDGRTWDEARLEWNERYPQETIGPDEHFSRDAREAYQRITGKPFRWKRRRGQKGG